MANPDTDYGSTGEANTADVDTTDTGGDSTDPGTGDYFYDTLMPWAPGGR